MYDVHLLYVNTLLRIAWSLLFGNACYCFLVTINFTPTSLLFVQLHRKVVFSSDFVDVFKIDAWLLIHYFIFTRMSLGTDC